MDKEREEFEAWRADISPEMKTMWESYKAGRADERSKAVALQGVSADAAIAEIDRWIAVTGEPDCEEERFFIKGLERAKAIVSALSAPLPAAEGEASMDSIENNTLQHVTDANVGSIPQPEEMGEQEALRQLLEDMRCQVTWTHEATMPIPLYKRIKEALNQHARIVKRKQ